MLTKALVKVGNSYAIDKVFATHQEAETLRKAERI